MTRDIKRVDPTLSVYRIEKKPANVFFGFRAGAGHLQGGRWSRKSLIDINNWGTNFELPALCSRVYFSQMCHACIRVVGHCRRQGTTESTWGRPAPRVTDQTGIVFSVEYPTRF